LPDNDLSLSVCQLAQIKSKHHELLGERPVQGLFLLDLKTNGSTPVISFLEKKQLTFIADLIPFCMYFIPEMYIQKITVIPILNAPIRGKNGNRPCKSEFLRFHNKTLHR
jgi:hypothetical protein